MLLEAAKDILDLGEREREEESERFFGFGLGLSFKVKRASIYTYVYIYICVHVFAHTEEVLLRLGPCRVDPVVLERGWARNNRQCKINDISTSPRHATDRDHHYVEQLVRPAQFYKQLDETTLQLHDPISWHLI